MDFIKTFIDVLKDFIDSLKDLLSSPGISLIFEGVRCFSYGFHEFPEGLHRLLKDCIDSINNFIELHKKLTKFLSDLLGFFRILLIVQDLH